MSTTSRPIPITMSFTAFTQTPIRTSQPQRFVHIFVSFSMAALRSPSTTTACSVDFPPSALLREDLLNTHPIHIGTTSLASRISHCAPQPLRPVRPCFQTAPSATARAVTPSQQLKYRPERRAIPPDMSTATLSGSCRTMTTLSRAARLNAPLHAFNNPIVWRRVGMITKICATLQAYLLLMPTSRPRMLGDTGMT